MKVVILAGGFGTRLSEYTDTIPKPMVTVGGRPIIWHIMNTYAKYGHTDFHLALGYKAIVPCTPLGCLLLIKKTEKNLTGKHAVILGRSNLNGKPMAQLLLKENCTVTIVHSKTINLKEECQKADILIAAVGVANLVKGDWVKKDSIIIDVGINKIGDKIVGDVKFDEVEDKVKAITPVPGGVGPMTIACLLKNTLECFKDR